MQCTRYDVARIARDKSLSPAYLRSEVAICPPHTYVVNTITTLLCRYGGGEGGGNKAHIATSLGMFAGRDAGKGYIRISRKFC